MWPHYRPGRAVGPEVFLQYWITPHPPLSFNLIWKSFCTFLLLEAHRKYIWSKALIWSYYWFNCWRAQSKLNFAKIGFIMMMADNHYPVNTLQWCNLTLTVWSGVSWHHIMTAPLRFHENDITVADDGYTRKTYGAYLHFVCVCAYVVVCVCVCVFLAHFSNNREHNSQRDSWQITIQRFWIALDRRGCHRHGWIAGLSLVCVNSIFWGKLE